MVYDWSSFEKYVLEMMEKEHIVGAAIAVSQKGKTIYQKGFGVSDLESKDRVTEETIFGIASVTKSFTAMAIMKLQEEGKLSVDDPVISHLPEFQLQGVQEIQSIKIKHLMSHSTGLPPIERKENLNKLTDHLTYLQNYKTNFLGMPGEYFSYCNDAFLILGGIIEKVTGRLYRRYITEEILNHLQLYRSTFSLEEIAKMDNISTPYDFNREKQVHEKQEWPALGNYEVGGGIRSCAKDLLKYGNAILNNKLPLNNMWYPFIQTDPKSYYGYAFKVTPQYHGVTLVEHGGGQPGVSSNFGFVPEEDLVVSVLTNVSGVPVSKIWLAAVNTALNLPLSTKIVEYPFYQYSTKEMMRFEGLYASDEGGKLKVFMEDENPMAETYGEILNLRGSINDTLILSKYDVPIRFFYKNNENHPWAAFIGSRMLLRK